MATAADQPSLADLFRALLAHLFALPPHTVDDALVAKVTALDAGLTTLGGTVGGLTAHVADDDVKLDSVKADVDSLRAVLLDFGSPPTPPVAEPPVAAQEPDPVT